MELNTVGPAAAIATFLGVWLGHVLVRELEYRAARLALPALGFALAGILLESGALLTASAPLSAGLGILGITALWGCAELFRQQRRVVRGHAPANPSNPRHARILERYPTATTLNLLERQPLGRPVEATGKGEAP
ncbi:MAG: DUF4491 family protein [Chloroflexota bacterium]